MPFHELGKAEHEVIMEEQTMALLKLAVIGTLLVALSYEVVRAETCALSNTETQPCLALKGAYELYGTNCINYENACAKRVAFRLVTSAMKGLEGVAEPGPSWMCYRVPEHGEVVHIVPASCE